MKTIYEVDADGFMTYETLEIEPNDFDGDNNPVYVIPEGYVGAALPSDEGGKQLPFWKPQWNGIEWIEARPQEEIDAEMNAPKEPGPIEIITQDVEAVAEMVAIVTEDSAMVAETVAVVVEDSLSIAETLALALLEIENLKNELATFKEG